MKLSGGKNIAELFAATAVQVTAPMQSLQLLNRQVLAAKSPDANETDFLASVAVAIESIASIMPPTPLASGHQIGQMTAEIICLGPIETCRSR